MTHHGKRIRLIGLMIQQHSWNLEKLRERDRVAHDLLAQANKELKEIEAGIEKTFLSIRHVMKCESSLDLSTIQCSRQFLADQQASYKGKMMEQQRKKQSVHQTETQVREATLYLKALKKVRAKHVRAMNLLQEKLVDEENAELWMQRYGRQ